MENKDNLFLNFTGPYSFEELLENDESNCPGIYIWGFKEIIELHPEKFVPYYVGLKVDSVRARIIQHKFGILQKDSTYMRLSENYMKCFFMDEPCMDFKSFPLKTGNDNKHLKLNWPGWNDDDFRKSIDYINNYDFLERYKEITVPMFLPELTDYPKSFIKNESDTLSDRVLKGNFYICFAKVDKAHPEYVRLLHRNGNKDRNAFEVIESYVKYSLIGRTISKSRTYDCWKDIKITINGLNEIFKGSPSKEFPGYI